MAVWNGNKDCLLLLLHKLNKLPALKTRFECKKYEIIADLDEVWFTLCTVLYII